MRSIVPHFLTVRTDWYCGGLTNQQWSVQGRRSEMSASTCRGRVGVRRSEDRRSLQLDDEDLKP